LILNPDGSARDWLAGYAPPASAFVDKLRAAAEGRDSVDALLGRVAAEPRNPEARIRLGRKYQVRTDLARASQLFREAAELDPSGTIMTRREDGTPVSCRDMAEFEMARSYAGGSGLYQPSRMEEFVKSHPASPFLPEARLLLSRTTNLGEARGRGFFAEAFAQAPGDPRFLAILEMGMRQIESSPEARPVAEASLDFTRRAGERLQTSSPETAARLLSRLLVLTGDQPGADEAYGPGFLSERTKAWAQSLLEYAEHWRTRKRNEEDALAAIGLALALRPQDTGIRQTAARLYLLRPPHQQEAETAFGSAWLKAADRTADDLLAYAGFWLGRKTNRESALAAIDALLAKSSDDLFFLLSAVSILWQAGETDRVEAVFGPAYAAAHADRLTCLNEYGSFWLARGLHVDTAVPALVKSAADPAQSWSIKLQAADLLIKAGKTAEGESGFGPDSFESAAEDVNGLAMFIQFWQRREKNEPAVLRALELLAARLDELPYLRLMAAAAYAKLGRRDKAEAVYGPAYVKTIMSKPEELIQYALFWMGKRLNLLSATEAAQAAVRAAPSNARGWDALANLLLIDGRAKEALAALDKAAGCAEDPEEKERYKQRRSEIAAAAIAGPSPKKAG